MNSFKKEKVELPIGIVMLLNTIAEFKGKQDLYLQQNPEILHSLKELALVESAESSNRIEGITISSERLRPIVLENSQPHDRSEEEVAGYRNALNLIHNSYQNLKISPETIKELHKLAQFETWDAGIWKEKDNEIIRKYPNGDFEVIYRPLSAKETPKAIEQMCLGYEYSLNQNLYPPLYAIACLILDFLCIHPFRDGNGRVSRLLTLLALYQHGFVVGKFVSLERIIEQSKENYYASLNKSSQLWVDGKHDILPWLHYFLGTILIAYKEFTDRAQLI